MDTPTQDLVNRFTYHAPTPTKAQKFVELRQLALAFARVIDLDVPEGREKSLALTKLEEAVMWANAGIARTP